MEKSRNKGIIFVTLFGVVFLSLFTFLFLKEGNFSPRSLLFSSFALLIALTTIALMTKRVKLVKKGEVIEDERTHIIAIRAGNVTSFVTLYLITFLAIFTKDNQLFGLEVNSSDILGILVLGMGIIYAISYLIVKSQNE